MSVPGAWCLVLLVTIVGCRAELPVTLKPGQEVRTRGEIASGTECPMLVVGPGRRFSLAGELGRFRVGDRVCVHGTIAEMSMCMAGEATIAVAAIAPEDSCP